MSQLHPLFVAALGRDVHLAYLRVARIGEPQAGTNAAHLYGTLGVAFDADDVLAELVIETDGSATFVPVSMVAQLEVLS